MNNRRGAAAVVNVLVRSLERGGQLAHQLQRLAERNRRAAQALEQGLADQPLHDDEDPAGLVLPAVADVDRPGWRMLAAARASSKKRRPAVNRGSVAAAGPDRGLAPELHVAPGIRRSLGPVTEDGGDR